MNRCFQVITAALALTAVVSTAAIAAPVAGTYRSTDLGGALFTGRASQSWVAPANAAGGAGDVYNAESWDGALLGTQWAIQCGLQGGPQGVQDNRVSGTGTVVYTNVFNGGTFYFNPGPWGFGTGTIANTVEIVTVQYVSNVPMAAVVNINTNGQFDNSNCLLTFAIANGFGQGDTDGGPKPATYPAFLDPACAPTRLFGSWGDVITIVARIDCPVPARSTTWGGLKSLYR